MTQQNPPTTLGELSATGTGQCHDKDGNLLDSRGNIVPQQESETN